MQVTIEDEELLRFIHGVARFEGVSPEEVVERALWECYQDYHRTPAEDDALREFVMKGVRSAERGESKPWDKEAALARMEGRLAARTASTAGQAAGL